jgi:hypothetical protein
MTIPEGLSRSAKADGTVSSRPRGFFNPFYNIEQKGMFGYETSDLSISGGLCNYNVDGLYFSPWMQADCMYSRKLRPSAGKLCFLFRQLRIGYLPGSPRSPGSIIGSCLPRMQGSWLPTVRSPRRQWRRRWFRARTSGRHGYLPLLYNTRSPRFLGA